MTCHCLTLHINAKEHIFVSAIATFLYDIQQVGIKSQTKNQRKT